LGNHQEGLTRSFVQNLGSERFRRSPIGTVRPDVPFRRAYEILASPGRTVAHFSTGRRAAVAEHKGDRVERLRVAETGMLVDSSCSFPTPEVILSAG
jgi:hypothetical protein